MTVDNAVSPGVSVGEALTSVIVLTSLYAVLAVIEFGLLIKYAKPVPSRSPSHRTRACAGPPTARTTTPPSPSPTRRRPWSSPPSGSS